MGESSVYDSVSLWGRFMRKPKGGVGVYAVGFDPEGGRTSLHDLIPWRGEGVHNDGSTLNLNISANSIFIGNGF
jgi:hypothetical protein